MFKRKDKREQSRFHISRELAKEFETIYDFKEKVSRVQTTEAEQLSRHFKIPLQIAKAVRQLEWDGIGAEKALELFQWALKIRDEIRSPVPQVSSYLFNFAVNEGVWIEYLYVKFPSVLERAMMSLANLERAFEKEDAVPAERIVGIIDARKNVVETLIDPLMEKWRKDHENAPSIYAAQAMVSAALKIPPDRAIDVMEKAKLELQKALKHLDNCLEEETLPEDGVNVKIRVLKLRMHLLRPVSDLDNMTLAEVVLNAFPRPELIYVEGEHPSVLVHSPVVRGGLVGPELKSSSDFLERDILLARRRIETERDIFLLERVKKAHRTLVLQGKTPVSAAAELISDMSNRFETSEIDEMKAKRIIIEKAAGDEKFEEFIRKMKLSKSIAEPAEEPVLEITPEMPHESSEDQAEEVQAMGEELTEELKEELTEELKEELTEELKEELTEELKEELTEELKQEVAEEVAEEVVKTEDVMGEELEKTIDRGEISVEETPEESSDELDEDVIMKVMEQISEKDVEKLGLSEGKIVESLAEFMRKTFVENNTPE